jgi:hypothetical protein
MFNKLRSQMINWRWDSTGAFRDHVHRSSPETTSSEKVKRTAECFSRYGSDDLRGKIQLPSCRQYKPDDFLAIRPPIGDEIVDKDDDDENGEGPRAPSSGRSRPGDVNENDNGEGQEYTQGGEKGTRKWKGTKNRNGKGMGEGKGNDKGKGIVKQTPGGDDISRAVALQWQKQMYEAEPDIEG